MSFVRDFVRAFLRGLRGSRDAERFYLTPHGWQRCPGEGRSRRWGR